MLHPKRAILIEGGNTLSGSTNLGLPGPVVHRTKSRIACFAGPSFHEGSAALEVVVCADAGAVNSGTDKAGSSAIVESKARQSIPERGRFPFMLTTPAIAPSVCCRKSDRRAALPPPVRKHETFPPSMQKRHASLSPTGFQCRSCRFRIAKDGRRSIGGRISSQQRGNPVTGPADRTSICSTQRFRVVRPGRLIQKTCL